MAAAMGAAMEKLLERLTSKEFYLPINNELLEKLKKVLLSVYAVVDDAEEKQYRNPMVKAWLDGFKDAFYHVEDLIDDIFTHHMKIKLESKYPQFKIKRDKPHSLKYMEGKTMKMEEILEKIEFVAKQKDELGLRETILGYCTTGPPITPTTSLVDQNGVFGRHDDKEEIIYHLLSARHEQPSVIAIVGMGGIGKTTLAQIVYNDDKVTKHFEVKIWACVTDSFDIFRVTKTIFEELTSEHFDFNEFNLLQLRLQERLRGKRFLLVLDDVWNNQSDDWEVLLAPFKVADGRSCIIVTTRSQRVAEIMNAVNAHHLKELSTSASSSLFVRSAFGDQQPSSYLELEDIGNKIVEKCHGLPLAVKSFAASLRSKLQVKEWRTALDCLTHFPTEMRDVPTEMRVVLRALKRSYDYLPAHLKLCFAYCSVFPKGFLIEKEKLVLLWMAEGLLQQHSGNRRMEDVGDEYFNELLARSFYQPSSLNKSRFCMHDLISDLAIYVTGRFGCSIHSLDDNVPSGSTAFVRYLSHFRSRFDSPEMLEFILDVKYLRTYLSVGHESLNFRMIEFDLLLGLKFLRVLSLSHHCITMIPTAIGSLIHIRYIDLSGNLMRKLPGSVCSLYNLQTLILSNCHDLTELPEDMWKLTNLRHLDISRTALDEMPKQMSRLNNLQTLPYFVAGKISGSTVKELGGLRHLHGTLCISKLQNVVSTDAAEVRLAKKTYLDELTLECGDKTVCLEDDKVLAQLVPHTNLKGLRISFYGGTTFPHWLGDTSFSQMQFLCLSNCKKCICLPPLGQLPSLKVLIIQGMDAVKKVGPEFNGNNKPNFRSLKTLRFEMMLKWEEWYPSVEFPCLEELSIRSCPKLKGQLPNQLPSVKNVQIFYSQELETALAMEKSSQKMLLHYLDKVLCTPKDENNEDEVASNTKNEGASKPMTKTTNITRDEANVLNDTRDSQDGLQNLSSSVSKKVSEISQLMNLPPNLHSLKIEGCDAEFIPEAVGINHLPLLQNMYIINCCSLKSYPGGRPPTSMKSLYIQNCKKLEFLLPGERMHQYEVLEHLCIGSSCDSLEYFPLGFFLKLKILSIWDCANLVSLTMPEGIQKDLGVLESLEIRDCPKLVSFPAGLPTPKLKSIWFSNCQNLKELPDQLHTLNSLQSMFINNCPELVSLPEEGLPSNLIVLSITSCNKLMLGMKWGLDRLHHLSRLEIEGGCGNLVSFPEKLLPSNLDSLRISGLLNLKFLDKGLQHLTTLKTLEISCCNRLRSLPEEGLPPSLSFLCIKECSLLKPKLQNKAGKDWSKIEHISRIEIN